jgi:hypothetical protein
METATLQPKAISPQNRREACYLHHDLATIAGQLYYLSSLLDAISCLECGEIFLEKAVKGLAFLVPSISGMADALDKLSNDIALPHGLSTTLVAPDWWEQVDELAKGGRIEKKVDVGK